MIKEAARHAGDYIINSSSGVEVIKNMITDAGLAAMAKALTGDPDIEIKYLALGTSDAAVTGAETQLGAEIFRTAITDISRSGSVVTSTFYVLSGEGIGQIEEIGIFVGSTASDTANSGTLLSRVLWSHEKTMDEEITITRVDTIGRG